MIDINDEKVRDTLNKIEKGMRNKEKRSGRDKDNFILESRVIDVICQDFDCGPTKCAISLNERFACDLCADQVIAVFRDLKIANPNDRKVILEWAKQVADLYMEAMTGDRKSFEQFEKRRREECAGGRRVMSRERIVAIMIYTRYPEIDINNMTERLYRLGNTFAKYFFYDMVDAVTEVYGYPVRTKADKAKEEQKVTGSGLTGEQALQRVEQLENTLERTNAMLQELQDEFDEQIVASKLKELTEFFSQLNSERYGCILDELLAARKGMELLKKKGYELPVEINGLLIMVRKLVQFVRDSHIDPMMKVDSIKQVKASDVEFCHYEGTPFMDSQEVKSVQVISPGWIYRDKQLQISRPRVKEVVTNIENS